MRLGAQISFAVLECLKKLRHLGKLTQSFYLLIIVVYASGCVRQQAASRCSKSENYVRRVLTILFYDLGLNGLSNNVFSLTLMTLKSHSSTRYFPNHFDFTRDIFFSESKSLYNKIDYVINVVI
jgi:hypothetical protein